MANGALSRNTPPPDAGYGALSQVGQPPPDAAAILDAATHRLLDGLDRLPYRAQAAAMLQSPGNFSAALGAGQEAGLNAEMAVRQMPMAAISQRAQAEMAMAQARQAELQNRIDMLNFGYMTAPWDQGGGATDQGQEPPGAAPAAGPGTAGPGGSVAGEPPGTSLPLTDQSQMQLRALQAQLSRALKFSRASPQARQDAYAIYDKMAQTVREDPLAKQHLETVQKQNEANIALDQTVRTHVADIGKEALTAAQAEYAKVVPEGTQVDPVVGTAWIKTRAKQIVQEQLAAYGETLRALGKDPRQYIGDAAGPTSAVTAPGASAPPVAPTAPAAPGTVNPAAAAELQSEIVREPTTGRPAPATPAAAPGVPPPTAAADPNALPALNPQPTPRNVARIQEAQGRAQSNIVTLDNTLRDLETALKLNDSALGGPGADTRKALLATKDFIYNHTARALTGAPQQSSQTLIDTERLDTILKGSLLARLNQAGPNDELSLGGLQGDNQIQDLINTPLELEPEVRKQLIIRAMRIIVPRLKFEQARLKALLSGKVVEAKDYPDWLRQSLPLDKAEKTLAGQPEE